MYYESIFFLPLQLYPSVRYFCRLVLKNIELIVIKKQPLTILRWESLIQLSILCHRIFILHSPRFSRVPFFFSPYAYVQHTWHDYKSRSSDRRPQRMRDVFRVSQPPPPSFPRDGVTLNYFHHLKFENDTLSLLYPRSLRVYFLKSYAQHSCFINWVKF